MQVEQLPHPPAIVGLDGAVSEHERHRRLGAALERGDVAAKGLPGREAVAGPGRGGRRHARRR